MGFNVAAPFRVVQSFPSCGHRILRFAAPHHTQPCSGFYTTLNFSAVDGVRRTLTGAEGERPDAAEDGTAALRRFLREVTAHVCNRASLQEQHTWQTYRIHKDQAPEELRELLPERGADSAERGEPASETSVLVGYYKDQAHLDWILGGREKLFNLWADLGRGSLRLESMIADASYVLLHTEGETVSGKLYRVLRRGPRVFAAETLKEKGYPHEPSRPFYLVYDIGPLEEGNPLRGCEWAIPRIPGCLAGRGSALPFGVSLSDLMKAKV